MKLTNFTPMSKCLRLPRTSRLGKDLSLGVRRSSYVRLQNTFQIHTRVDKEPSITAQGTRRGPHRRLRTPRRRDQVHQRPQASLRLARSVPYLIFISRVEVLKTRVGTFAETSSPEDQLHWIFENCKVVRGANGLPNIVEAMKIASSKHDLLWLVIS
jgi:hypothetical protein